MSNILYATEHKLSIKGLIEDEPVYRDEKGNCYIISSESDLKAFPIMDIDNGNVSGEVWTNNASTLYLGPITDCLISDLSWDEHSCSEDQLKTIIFELENRVTELKKENTQTNYRQWVRINNLEKALKIEPNEEFIDEIEYAKNFQATIKKDKNKLE